ncbi:phage tail component protein, partial [Ancylostoma caninum]
YASVPQCSEEDAGLGTAASRQYFKSQGLSEERRYRLAFLFAVAVVAAFVITIVYNNGDAEEKVNVFHAKESPYSNNISSNQPLSEEQVRKVEESYRMQELTIENGTTFDDLDSIKQNNSDPLPSRKFVGVAAEEMCQSGNACCVQPFARIRPLIVVCHLTYDTFKLILSKLSVMLICIISVSTSSSLADIHRLWTTVVETRADVAP